jgi:hypothetical protein
VISTNQIEALKDAEALLRKADLMIVQARLPALMSGVNELGCGLSKALGAVKLILGNYDPDRR